LSLLGFQQALAALAADPGLGQRIQQDPTTALAAFELTRRELRRLAIMARDRGMAVNWTLYRANRLTPLNRILPLTLAVLGPDLRRTLDLFWRAYDASLQSAGEAGNFAQFLKAQLAVGAVVSPILEEVLDFEIAICELRFLSRRQAAVQVADVLPEAATSSEVRSRALTCHPLIRVVAFRHDPSLLLRLLAESRQTDCTLPEGEHYLLLDWRLDELRLGSIDPPLGSLLKTFEKGVGLASSEKVVALRRAGYLIAS
jgi:hypothetical protein